MEISFFDLYSLVLFASALCSFLLGYRRGKKIGQAQGSATTTLKLKEQSLARGYCILCSSQQDLRSDIANTYSCYREEEQ